MGDEFLSPCPSISLDPDQPLDDIVNCIKLCEPDLGDHTMRGTIGIFNRQLAPDEKERGKTHIVAEEMGQDRRRDLAQIHAGWNPVRCHLRRKGIDR